MLPAELRHELDTSGLLVGSAASPGFGPSDGDRELTTIRQAIRIERKLAIRYRDASDADSVRTIWPFALGFFDRVRVVVAWCELRQSIRHFRTDRITGLTLTDDRYPRRRQALLKDWRAQEGIRTQ